MKIPTFNPVFTAVLTLTLSSGGTALHLGSQPSLTPQQDRLLDSAISLWTMGTTTLIGLLSAHPGEQSDEDDDQA